MQIEAMMRIIYQPQKSFKVVHGIIRVIPKVKQSLYKPGVAKRVPGS